MVYEEGLKEVWMGLVDSCLAHMQVCRFQVVAHSSVMELGGKVSR